MWVSELQGGSACDGLCVHPPVDARSQQRWVWNGISHGAKATIFWCWRDEVFGRESSGFGIIGSDGSVEERLAALRETGRVLARCGDRLESYQPDAGEVGLFVEPSNHMIEFARYGHAPLVVASLSAYATALARGNWSFEVVDPGHLDILEHLRLLILPLPLVIREDAAQRIVRFVENGGTLLTEGELDAFSDMGFYRSPGPDRTFATSLGIREVGRRPLLSAELGLTFAGESFCLKPSGWMTPYVEAAGEILGRDAIGWPVAIAQPWGRGRVIALGSFFGKAYEEARYDDFERCLAAVARSAGIRPPLRVESTGKVYWKTGLASGTQGAGRHRLVFLLNPGPCQRAKIAGEAVSLEEFSHAEEVFSGAVIERSDGGFAVELPEKGVALLSCH
jgi:beta-galactosidase